MVNFVLIPFEPLDLSLTCILPCDCIMKKTVKITIKPKKRKEKKKFLPEENLK